MTEPLLVSVPLKAWGHFAAPFEDVRFAKWVVDNVVVRAGHFPARRSAILASPAVRAAVCERAGLPPATDAATLVKDLHFLESAAEAGILLDCIGDGLNTSSIVQLSFYIRKIFRRVFSSMMVEFVPVPRSPCALTSLRSLPYGEIPVLFLPTHRSYMDFLLLSYIVACIKAPCIPHIGAADDFLGLGPVATLLRNCGAFFLRRVARPSPALPPIPHPAVAEATAARSGGSPSSAAAAGPAAASSLPNDPACTMRLYSALFKAYVQALVVAGEPIEFFCEGTRARGGRMLPPKFGMLRMVLSAVVDDAVRASVATGGKGETREVQGVAPRNASEAAVAAVDAAIRGCGETAGPVVPASPPRRTGGGTGGVSRTVDPTGLSEAEVHVGGSGGGGASAPMAAGLGARGGAVPPEVPVDARPRDVIIVPVSTTYDRLLEASSYARELHGVPKAPETTANLLKAADVLLHKFGGVQLTFGVPFSLYGAAGTAPIANDLTTPSSAPAGSSNVVQLCHRVTDALYPQLSDGIRITRASVMALVVLYGHPFATLRRHNGVPLARVGKDFESVKAVLGAHGARLAASWTGNVTADAKAAAHYLGTVVRFSKRSARLVFSGRVVDPPSMVTDALGLRGRLGWATVYSDIIASTHLEIYAATLTSFLAPVGIHHIATTRGCSEVLLRRVLTPAVPTLAAFEGRYLPPLTIGESMSVSGDAVHTGGGRPMARLHHTQQGYLESGYNSLPSAVVDAILEAYWLVAMVVVVAGEGAEGGQPIARSALLSLCTRALFGAVADAPLPHGQSLRMVYTHTAHKETFAAVIASLVEMGGLVEEKKGAVRVNVDRAREFVQFINNIRLAPCVQKDAVEAMHRLLGGGSARASGLVAKL